MIDVNAYGMVQKIGETTQLYEFLEKLKPERILEIGTLYGGTARLWASLKSVKKVVTVDVQPPEIKDKKIVVVKGDSQANITIDLVKRLGPFDFIFIDGDHSLGAVTKDWEVYGPMGKWVGFHDVVPHVLPGGNVLHTIEVYKLWDELKKRPGAIEFITDELTPNGETWGGIGVVKP